MSYLARCFCLICLLLFCKTGYSQKIILIDSTNNIPISDVTVFGKQSFKSIISNNKGIVDLELMSIKRLLTFNLKVYQLKILQDVVY